MLTREELIAAIDNIDEKQLLTIRNITDILKEDSTRTVAGWVSYERDFPVAERGARNQKNYNKQTFIKLCLYVHAMRGNGGVRIGGPTAIQRLNDGDVNAVLALLREGQNSFFRFFTDTAGH